MEKKENKKSNLSYRRFIDNMINLMFKSELRRWLYFTNHKDIAGFTFCSFFVFPKLKILMNYIIKTIIVGLFISFYYVVIQYFVNVSFFFLFFSLTQATSFVNYNFVFLHIETVPDLACFNLKIIDLLVSEGIIPRNDITKLINITEINNYLSSLNKVYDDIQNHLNNFELRQTNFILFNNSYNYYELKEIVKILELYTIKLQSQKVLLIKLFKYAQLLPVFFENKLDYTFSNFFRGEFWHGKLSYVFPELSEQLAQQQAEQLAQQQAEQLAQQQAEQLAQQQAEQQAEQLAQQQAEQLAQQQAAVPAQPQNVINAVHNTIRQIVAHVNFNPAGQPQNYPLFNQLSVHSQNLLVGNNHVGIRFFGTVGEVAWLSYLFRMVPMMNVAPYDLQEYLQLRTQILGENGVVHLAHRMIRTYTLPIMENVPNIDHRLDILNHRLNATNASYNQHVINRVNYFVDRYVGFVPYNPNLAADLTDQHLHWAAGYATDEDFQPAHVNLPPLN